MTPTPTRTYGESVTFHCDANDDKQHCENEMRVSPVLIDNQRSIMLSIAKPHEWGSNFVRSVALNAEHRAKLRRIVNDDAWWGE